MTERERRIGDGVRRNWLQTPAEARPDRQPRQRPDGAALAVVRQLLAGDRPWPVGIRYQPGTRSFPGPAHPS